jgi:amino acid adenylation domain-containing protein
MIERGSIIELFERNLLAHSGRPAVVCAGRQISYRELDRSSNAIGLALRQAGLRRGQLVGLLAQRSLEAIVAMLGILKAGGAYLPFDGSYPPNLLRFIYEDSKPAAMLVQRTMREQGAPAPFWSGRAFYLEPDGAISGDTHARESDADRPVEPPHADDLAYVMYTSGSTGHPKGVMVPHRGIIRLVSDCSFVSLGPDEVILQLAPLSFDASTFEIWGALLNGGRLAVLPAPHPSLDDIVEAIGAYGVTTMWLTAGLFNLMAERHLEGLKLRQLVVGGDVLAPPQIAKALEVLPACRIVNGYGPTENTTFTCCYTIPRGRAPTGSIPIGTPIRGTEIHVLDAKMHAVPDGEEGELYASGAGVALGYINRPSLTAEKFVADPFHGEKGGRLYRTGDRVWRRSDGNLEFLGRVDRQVKIDGKRVELDEIEVCLRKAAAIRDAAVVGQVDGNGRKSIAAFVVGAKGRVPVPAELRAFLRTELPDYMIPKAVIVLDALPISPTGKVDRARLSQWHAPLMPAAGGLRPTNGTEATLQKIWGGVLGFDLVPVATNFFDLGGTSLQLIEIHARIVQTLGATISLVDLFEHPTVADLAAKIDGKTSANRRVADPQYRSRMRNVALARARKGAA